MRNLLTYRADAAIVMCLIVFGIVMRLVPHLPNATPLTAVALASSLYVNRKWALFMPVLTVFLSDALIGSYDWRVMTSVYVSWVLIGGIGLLATRRQTIFSIAGMTLASSLLFFLITNFAVWAFTPWYPKTLAGVLSCYELGLPFLRNMMLGDFMYTPLLLGAFALSRIRTNLGNTLLYARS